MIPRRPDPSAPRVDGPAAPRDLAARPAAPAPAATTVADETAADDDEDRRPRRPRRARRSGPRGWFRWRTAEGVRIVRVTLRDGPGRTPEDGPRSTPVTGPGARRGRPAAAGPEHAVEARPDAGSAPSAGAVPDAPGVLRGAAAARPRERPPADGRARPGAGAVLGFVPGLVLVAVLARRSGELPIGLAVATVLYVWAGAAAVAWLLHRPEPPENDHEIDHGRWARREQLAPLLVARTRRRGRTVLGVPREPRVPGDRLVAAGPGHAVLVVAPPEQGASEAVVVPAVLDWEGPVVVVSATRETFDRTAGGRSAGGEVRVLDPAGLTDPERVRGGSWTPLTEARSWPSARTVAGQLVGVGRRGDDDPDGLAGEAAELLAGLLFAAAHSTVPSMWTVVRWLADPERAAVAVPRLLDAMAEDPGLDDVVRGNAPHALGAVGPGTADAADVRGEEAVWSAAARAVRAWTDPRLSRVRPDDPGTLHPDWLWSAPGPGQASGDRRTLYVLAPEDGGASTQSLVVAAVAQIHRAYARAGLEGRLPAGRLLVVLEDVARTAPVPELDVWVTAARGLGIGLVLTTPDLSRLDATWGRDKARAIVVGPRVRMFGPGLRDGRTIAHVERPADQPDPAPRRPSRPGTTAASPAEHAVPGGTLRGLPAGVGLVLADGVPPLTVAWRSAATDRDLAARTDRPPPAPGPREIEHRRAPRAHRPRPAAPELAGDREGPGADRGAAEDRPGGRDFRVRCRTGGSLPGHPPDSRSPPDG